MRQQNVIVKCVGGDPVRTPLHRRGPSSRGRRRRLRVVAVFVVVIARDAMVVVSPSPSAPSSPRPRPDLRPVRIPVGGVVRGTAARGAGEDVPPVPPESPTSRLRRARKSRGFVVGRRGRLSVERNQLHLDIGGGSRPDPICVGLLGQPNERRRRRWGEDNVGWLPVGRGGRSNDEVEAPGRHHLQRR